MCRVTYFNAFVSNMPWLESRTIFLTKHGSHAYGTNIPSSDLDIKGVAIPPKQYFAGFNSNFEQAETNTPNDLVIYDIRKFFKLAADCNPNICEVLFTDESHWLSITDVGRQLVDNRQFFISKKARWTFSGYATAQLKKIQRHYKFLKDPPVSPPNRADFNLPDHSVIPKDQLAAAQAAIQKRIDSWSLDLTGLDDANRINILNQINNSMTEFSAGLGIDVDSAQTRSAATLLGYDDNLLELLDRERKYQVKQREWVAYRTWKTNRNAARAEIEAKYGYDCKHAMHLIRLLRMCREILTTGKVVVNRPDRDELLFIRNGGWSYESVVEFATSEDIAMDDLYKTSTLPREPNRQLLDNLCITMVDKINET